MGQLNFSLTQLEYVLAVHKYGHFAKAAESCFVTQPTLSMQIQKLEENIGATIFDRNKKPIRLTVEGEAILNSIQNVLSQAKNIETTLTTLKNGDLAGELTVGVIPTIGPYLMPYILKTLEERLPKVIFKFHELQTSEILDRLKSDLIDVGIAAIPIENSSFTQEPLYYEPFLVYCAENHRLAKDKKVTPQKLTTEDIWLLEEGHCLRSQVLEVCRTSKKTTHVHSHLSFESGSLEMMRNLIHTIGGYTLIPFLASNIKNPKAVIREISGLVPARQVGLIYSRQHYKQAILKVFHEIIKQSVPPQLHQLKKNQLDVISVNTDEV